MSNEYTQEFEKVLVFLRDEFGKIRTGRAHVSLVEMFEVEAYGVNTPLNQLASLSVPEPRTIAIAPWDKHVLGSIEKAIRSSDMNVSPVNDGEMIRIVLPALTEDSRKELVKGVNKKAEEARIRVRTLREDILRDVDKAKESGEMSEDDIFRKRQEVQKIVESYNEKIEGMRQEKEKEVMTV